MAHSRSDSGGTPRYRATPKSNVGLRDLPRPNNTSPISAASLRKAWINTINEAAPPGIDARSQDNVGDAWRHYASAAATTDIIRLYSRIVISGIPIPVSLIKIILDMTETGSSNTAAQHEMDKANNRAGADTAGDAMVKDYLAQKALDFMVDVGRGKVKVIDARTGQTRDANAGDIPHTTISDTDRSYTHPSPAGGRDDDTMIA